MNVTVRTVALVKTLLGQGELDVPLPEGATIDTLFRRLGELGDERLAPYVAVPDRPDEHLPLRIMVNGHGVAGADGRRTVLAEGDEVFIFMPLAGG